MKSLEQLLGSRSVGSVVTTQLHFRALNLLGSSLLLIWAFSPLGSQSILRILGSRLEPMESISSVTYYDNLHESGFAGLYSVSPGLADHIAGFSQYLNSLFTATLMTPEATKLDPMDQWGNVKIPFLPAAKTGSEKNQNEWQEMSEIPDLERYSSLAGIPVANVSFGNTSLSIESTYIELDCYSVTSRQPLSVMNISWTWENVLGGFPMDETPIPANGTWEGITSDNFDLGEFSSWHMAINNFVDYYWVNETAQT